MVTAGQVASDSVSRFAELFAQTATGTGAIAGGAIASGVDEASNLGQSIVERVRELLALAALPSSDTMGLELSPLGDIYVSTELADRGHVEEALGRDAQLRELLGRWSSLTGQKTFHYSP